MKYLIHTEGFEITEAIRNFAQQCIGDIHDEIPEKISVEAFLKAEGPAVFSCTLKAHAWKRDWVVKERGPDLYSLIAMAHKSLVRNLHKAKEKRKALIHRRAQRERMQAFDSHEPKQSRAN